MESSGSLQAYDNELLDQYVVRLAEYHNLSVLAILRAQFVFRDIDTEAW